ncbi:DUF4233 domain-containing protein [Nesterenkonia massiliensis]|uniref:DUF4233 domain-containing protein n=1 Tax=Nesterenkonia massiliensis TaxID=1232429 RepID=A0ABT2HNF1_9MICC|nr:DUF4233 domain-containing protein [Nesterenkonia massiliensis]MCT1606080.1 DUF4233 domain-containing protein [Nesterenkonia massiliensis]
MGRRLSRAQQQWQPGQTRPPRSVRVLFSSTVLSLEAALMLFFGLAAWGLNQHEWYAWWIFGGSLVVAVACIMTCALLQKPLGYIIGWALQAVIVAGFLGTALVTEQGLWAPLALLPGLGFLACWWYAVTKGAQIDAEKMERYRLEQEFAGESEGAPGEK